MAGKVSLHLSLFFEVGVGVRAGHRRVRETRHASGCSLTLGFEAVE